MSSGHRCTEYCCAGLLGLCFGGGDDDDDNDDEVDAMIILLVRLVF
jgi:hypothetical protein